MAEQWYGYGRWEAPFWFLGPEPGGPSPDGPLRAWDELGRGELLDCEEHHLAFGCNKWHREPVRLQTTWGRLILLLKSYKQEDPALEARKLYQAQDWGTKNRSTGRLSETCVIELCSVAAPAMGMGTYDDSAVRSRRIEHIRDRLQDHHPEFLVMYGLGWRREWEQIVGGEFDEKGIRRVGNTVAMITPHPAAYGQKNEEWVAYGSALRFESDQLTRQEI